MITISLCMIVKNEEETLRRCLDSVKKACNEIIIVDTGSTDKTKEIAKEFTNKVYDFKWVNDFSAARNFAFSKSTMDYQMWLDADDIFTEDNMDKLLNLKASLLPEIDMVLMKYHTSFDENGIPIFTSERERLIKRTKGYRWEDPVHEYITISGNFIHSDICIEHKKVKDSAGRNLTIYDSFPNKDDFSPRSTYYYGRELYDNERYDESIVQLNKFIDSNLGWVEDVIWANFLLSQCYFRTNQTNLIEDVLFSTFKLSTPRGEICTQLGYYYKSIGKYEMAIEWFNIALNLNRPESFAFISEDYWSFLPALEACICYYKINKIEKSNYYHKLSKKFKPNSPIVLSNDKFF